MCSRDHRGRHRLPGVDRAAPRAAATRTLVTPHEAHALGDRRAHPGWLRRRPRRSSGATRRRSARSDAPGKLLASFFQGVTPRTAGFNTLDYGAMSERVAARDRRPDVHRRRQRGARPAGSRSTTLALIALMVWAEIRGEPEVNAFGRRIPASAQRQALAVTLIGLGRGRGRRARRSSRPGRSRSARASSSRPPRSVQSASRPGSRSIFRRLRR